MQPKRERLARLILDAAEARRLEKEETARKEAAEVAAANKIYACRVHGCSFNTTKRGQIGRHTRDAHPAKYAGNKFKQTERSIQAKSPFFAARYLAILYAPRSRGHTIRLFDQWSSEKSVYTDTLNFISENMHQRKISTKYVPGFIHQGLPHELF